MAQFDRFVELYAILYVSLEQNVVFCWSHETGAQ